MLVVEDEAQKCRVPSSSATNRNEKLNITKRKRQTSIFQKKGNRLRTPGGSKKMKLAQEKQLTVRLSATNTPN